MPLGVDPAQSARPGNRIPGLEVVGPTSCQHVAQVAALEGMVPDEAVHLLAIR